jgi:ATP-dependent DNA helicase RecG
MSLDESVTSLKGVGDSLANKLHKLGVYTIGDLINYYPRKYDDYSDIKKINQIKPGMVTIKAKISQTTSRYIRRGMNITEAIASDDTSSVRLVWFNQPYRAKSIDPNIEYFIRGDFGLRNRHLSILSPSIELVSEFPVHSARIVPTYKTTKGLKNNQIRKIIASLIKDVDSLPESLPEWVIEENSLVSKSKALSLLHYPESEGDIKIAKHRLGFEEIFQLAVASQLNKTDNQKERAFKIKFDEVLAKQFVSSLPFELTNAQRKTVWQIYKDLEGQTPMNRLIEGDVGSGKTVVACMAALMAINSGYQVAVMAPTEILARQHSNTFEKLLSAVGMADKLCLLLGRMTASQKKNAYNAISSGKAGLIIGTSSLIQKNLEMHKLALVVIDEQHRFGVEQRKKLQQKAKKMPHVLSMTATPIPRSLALVIYGELDVSIIDEKPKGRQLVDTSLVSPNSITQMYEKIRLELNSGRQAMVVCPAINDDGEDSDESVISTYKKLSNSVFSEYRVGLLHGKLKAPEKESVMEEFADGRIDVLVSTTVIEVGVDVPNSSVMVIMSPEKFGLAQIHQLRGRVGRGEHKSYCYLVLSDSNKPSQRLRALEATHNGFELAEIDLEIRGPGAIYGSAQHGEIDLRVANISDTKLIRSARNSAIKFVESKEKLSKYSELHDNVNRLRKITNLN